MRRVLTPAHATFSAANRTISFATTVPASISHILKVTNLTRGVVLFDPTAESGDGYLSSATYASPVLTLVVSTAGMADSDKLFIEYDDGQSGGGGGGGGGGGDATAANQVLQLTELESIAGLGIPAHDHVALGYTGSNLTTVTYRSGGSGGTVVGTLTLAYSGSTLTPDTRS